MSLIYKANVVAIFCCKYLKQTKLNRSTRFTIEINKQFSKNGNYRFSITDLKLSLRNVQTRGWPQFYGSCHKFCLMIMIMGALGNGIAFPLKFMYLQNNGDVIRF